MKKTNQINPRSRQRQCIALTSFALLLLFAGSLQASWLDKGVEILKQTKTPQASSSSGLSIGDMSSGLKEALRVGSENVVNQLGSQDGFNLDPQIHIPLPQSLKTVQKTMGAVGMGGLLDDLELRLNRAAEAATPQAKELFLGAITDMTFADAKAIFEGPDDSATRYFQQKLTPDLTERMRPIVDDSLASAGAVQAYDNVMGQYKTMPFVPDAKANLTEYVTEKGLAGIFHYLAKEEAAIRTNPVKRTTDLLQRVFGSR